MLPPCLEMVIAAGLIERACANIVLFYVSPAEIWMIGIPTNYFSEFFFFFFCQYHMIISMLVSFLTA